MEQKFLQVFHTPEYGLDQSEVTEIRIRSLLQKMPEDRAVVLLADFEKNIRTNRDTIRNPTAYFMGMANRVIQALDIPDSRRVQQELDRLYYIGKIRPNDLDDRCRDSLKQLPELNAMEALHELDNTDISTLNNVSAFFMGLMKKYAAPSGSGSRRDMSGPDLGFGRDRERDMGGGPYAMYHNSPRGQLGHEHGERGFHPPPLLPPGAIPWDLLYGFGDQEYRPEMPRILEGTYLQPAVQDQLEILIKRGILRPEDMDPKVINELKKLPAEFAMTVAKEFSSLDRSSVRNVPNYLCGIARRVAHTLEIKQGGVEGADDYNRAKRPLDYNDRVGPTPHQPSPYYAPSAPTSSGGYVDRSMGPGGMRGGGDPMAKRFRAGMERGEDRSSHYGPPPVPMGRSEAPPIYGMPGQDEMLARQKIDIEIDRNVRAGVIRHDDIDDRVRHYLAAQSPWIASKAIADFCAKDMSRINNKSNFLKGIVRKLVEKEAEMAAGMGGGTRYPPHMGHMGGGGRGGGGMY